MVMTARHLANLAPSSTYSSMRSRSPSRPSVTFSPSARASALAPVSTLIPGMIPQSWIIFGNGLPSEDSWRMVSSYRITPLMCLPMSGAVSSSSR